MAKDRPSQFIEELARDGEQVKALVTCSTEGCPAEFDVWLGSISFKSLIAGRAQFECERCRTA